ncbi:ABC transporter permease [Tissierella sp. MSJ-40]|uniref:ABC transporter permease n=1 Tax=Tissierella simiarum TaxID=2841534 RepID=A0ABS6E6H0_9FIRM|nr:ABC transporter permease [Tissierella simiarum]MBU5438364.1 ABC transporter permease [Tissierella simiarum]
MKNGIIVEWKKIRHKNMLKTSLVIIFLFITIIVLKDIFINLRVRELGIESWIISLDTILIFMIIPAISGILYTSMINSEYAERTIVNYISAIVNRNTFIMSKLIAWMFCHLLMVLIVCLVAYIGSLVIFPTTDLMMRFYDFGVHFLKSALFSFFSLALLVPISIFQRSSYVPSIVATLGIAAVGVSATYLTGILPFILPWTAAFILSQPISVPNNLKILGYVIIIVFSLLFYILGLVMINRQDM